MADVSQSRSGETSFSASRHPLPGQGLGNLMNGAEHSGEAGEASPAIRSSLEALARMSLDQHATLPINPAALSTRLPDSHHEIASEDSASHEVPSNEEAERQQREPAQLHRLEIADSADLPPFTQRIDKLKETLPHLQNIRHPSRQRNAKIDCYDFSKGKILAARHAIFHGELEDCFFDDNVPLSLAFWQQPSSRTDLRLFVIEDLSSDLLELLGSLFDMSAEAFEEHLLNSGWRDRAQLDRTEGSWITRDMVKDYVSVKWYRPVRRQLQKPATHDDRAALLDPLSPKRAYKWTENVIDDLGKTHVVHHSSVPISNLFRKGWDIHAEVTQSEDASKIVAWEERATIWSRKRQHYRIVIVLVDPLPMVSDQVSGAEKALEKLGLYEPPAITVPNTDSTENSETNIRNARAAHRNAFVRKRTRVRPGSGRDIDLGFLQIPGYIYGLFVGNNRTTQDSHQNQHSVDPEDAQEGQTQDFRHITARSPPQRNPSRLSEGPDEAANTVTDGLSDLSHAGEDAGVEILTLDPIERTIFKGFLPRGPPLGYRFLMSLKNYPVLEQHLNTESSTSNDFAAWIQYRSDWQESTPTHFGPSDYIFAIIQRDTVNALRLMDQALTQIGRDILDDSLIQQRLRSWRLLLERFDADLRALEKSVRGLAKFIASLTEPKTHDQEENSKSSPFVESLLQECVADIANMKQRTQSSYQSLMANMSIVESKRGIAEAESVTKLTELAFFFIPLTFSASIFSMQVKELSGNNISVSTFIILALIVTFLSYALRLFIRSQTFTKRRREWLQDIRADARLAPGAPIPTTSFLLWLWRRVGLITIVVILTMALIVSPIVTLWTRDIDRGFKAVLTVLLLVLTVFGSYVMIVALLYVDARGLHVRRNIFKGGPGFNKRQPKSFGFPSWMTSSWAILILIATAVVAGPLTALWTRASLANGIKLGATFAIGTIYISFAVFVLLRAIPIMRGNQQPREEDE